MNDQIDNDHKMSLSQALEVFKTREGRKFLNEKVNLDELQRLTGISRGKLRRIKKTILKKCRMETRGKEQL